MPIIYGYKFYMESHNNSYIKFKWNGFYVYLTKKYFINNKLTLNGETIIKFIRKNDCEAFDTFFKKYTLFYENNLTDKIIYKDRLCLYFRHYCESKKN